MLAVDKRDQTDIPIIADILLVMFGLEHLNATQIYRITFINFLTISPS